MVPERLVIGPLYALCNLKVHSACEKLAFGVAFFQGNPSHAEGGTRVEHVHRRRMASMVLWGDAMVHASDPWLRASTGVLRLSSLRTSM